MVTTDVIFAAILQSKSQTEFHIGYMSIYYFSKKPNQKPMNMLQILLVRLLTVFVALSSVTTIYAGRIAPKSSDLSRRIANLNTVIDVRVNSDVIEEVNFYIEKRRKDAQIILGRTSLYFPLIEEIIRREGLPEELKAVAVIESSLIPNISSHAGASGMWQIMKGTGEKYGLNITNTIDERRDLVRSTEVAMKLLSRLYTYYGDWTMALAAYNCGDGTVNKAIAKSGGKKDYWSIHEYLPRETQKFIPRYIAAHYLLNYYFLHDLSPTEPSELLKYTLSIKTFNKVDFKKLSRELNLDLKIIKTLNPMYSKDYIPKSTNGSYYLTLPDSAMYAYIDLYNVKEALIASNYSIKREDLKVIARQQNFRQENEQMNTLMAPLTIKRDQLDDKYTNVLQIENKNYHLYRLKRKESLQDVANKISVALEDLINLNSIDLNKGVPPGSIIRLPRV